MESFYFSASLHALGEPTVKIQPGDGSFADFIRLRAGGLALTMSPEEAIELADKLKRAAQEVVENAQPD